MFSRADGLRRLAVWTELLQWQTFASVVRQYAETVAGDSFSVFLLCVRSRLCFCIFRWTCVCVSEMYKNGHKNEKLPLSTLKRHIGGTKVSLHLFLAPALHTGDWLLSLSGRFAFGTNLDTYWIARWVSSRAGLEVLLRRKILALPEVEPRTVQPTAQSQYSVQLCLLTGNSLCRRQCHCSVYSTGLFEIALKIDFKNFAFSDKWVIV